MPFCPPRDPKVCCTMPGALQHCCQKQIDRREAEVCLTGATYFCLARAPPLLRLLALPPGLLSLARAAGALPSPAPGAYRVTCTNTPLDNGRGRRGGGGGNGEKEANSLMGDHWCTQELSCLRKCPDMQHVCCTEKERRHLPSCKQKWCPCRSYLCNLKGVQEACRSLRHS